MDKFTGERIIWSNPADHLKEFKTCIDFYLEAMQYAKDRRVIDAACGTGFGSFLLSQVAKEVMGIDKHDLSESWGPLQTAAREAGKDLRFTHMDLEIEQADFGADLCVSIETIEHLENPDLFLSGLRTDGIFFSIPCYGDKNPFHKIEYTEEKSAELIKKYFPILEYRMDHRRMIGVAFKKEQWKKD